MNFDFKKEEKVKNNKKACFESEYSISVLTSLTTKKNERNDSTTTVT